MDDTTRQTAPARERSLDEYHYGPKHFFMTAAEHGFFRILDAAFGQDYYIFPQVHLATIINIHEHRWQRWYAAFRSIDEKSVDYVICDRKDISPQLVIELDDWSHHLRRRRSRDKFVEHVLREAQLELLRIEQYQDIPPEEIERRVRAKLPMPVTVDSDPSEPMVLAAQ